MKRSNAERYAASQARYDSKWTRGLEPAHGTVDGYNNWQCRCQPCRDAWAAYYTAARHERAEIDRLLDSHNP